jgi:hypothetical protein
MADIYNACLRAKHFEYTHVEGEKKTKYKLMGDLLMIFKDDYKICVPPSMVGLLLSHHHLIAHKGLTRMLAELEPYHFKNKYSITKGFVQSCYSCFLSQTGTKRVKLGSYPTPTCAFEEISVDLAENLNTSGGYSHLLIVKCYLTDFVLIFPLKSKTNNEISKWLTYGLQGYPVKRIHSDNAKAFRNLTYLKRMSVRGITVINSSAQNPQAKGFIESTVKMVKLLLKRMLATLPNYDWEGLVTHVAFVLNTSVSPRTNHRPIEMVFGKDIGPSYLDSGIPAKPHYLVKNDTVHIEELTEQVAKATRDVRNRLTELREKTNEKINKTRINKNFKPHDYVFTIDRSVVPGATQPLRTKLNPSPFIVIKPLYTTSIIKRLSDGYTILYSNNDLKRYNGASPLFSQLPVEVTKVLLYSFKDLLSEDLSKLTKYDKFDIPTGIKLFLNDKKEKSDSNKTDDEEVQEILEDLDRENIRENPLSKRELKILPNEEEDSEEEEEDEGEEEEIEEEEDLPRLGPRNTLKKTVKFQAS